MCKGGIFSRVYDQCYLLMLYPFTFGAREEGGTVVRGQGERKKSGSRQHQCRNDANFGAMGNLQAEQDQMDDSSKWKSAVWLADNWKLIKPEKQIYIPRGVQNMAD